MQGVTHIAPGVGVVLTIQFITTLAGVTTPLAFGIAFLIVLALGASLTQLAKYHPSAGGYYTYIRQTVGVRAGFLAAWLYFLYDPASTAVNLAFMGFFLQGAVAAELSIHFPWWAFFVPAALLITFLTYRGIEISAQTMVWLSIAEVAILAGLSITGLFRPGPGGISTRSYFPGNAPSAGGLYLGVVFSIFCFTGFESVAPLAEESENPRRTLPKAIVWSILLAGVFFIFCSWAFLIAWGTNDLARFSTSPENPILLIAKKLWGRAWFLVFIAVANSILGASIACTNAATRVFYAMARAGSLPRALGRIHPQYRTPVNAVWLQLVITLLVGLGVGFWIGPDQEYYFMGVAMTLGLILVYIAGNYGVYRYFRLERPDEFGVLLHLVFPLLSSAALLWVGYKSISPLPPAPLRYAPLLVGLWMIAGLLLIAFLPERKLGFASPGEQ